MTALERLMELLKEYRPTFSDTPGMGNLEDWQFRGSTYPPDNSEGMGLQSLLNSKGPQSWGGMMNLEKYLMDSELRNFLEARKYYYDKGPRYQVHPNQKLIGHEYQPMPYDRLPGSPLSNANKRM